MWGTSYGKDVGGLNLRRSVGAGKLQTYPSDRPIQWSLSGKLLGCKSGSGGREGGGRTEGLGNEGQPGKCSFSGISGTLFFFLYPIAINIRSF